MPDRKNEQEAMERSRGTRREEQRGTESGSRTGKTHQPGGAGAIDDESDKFEGYDQRLR